MFLRFSVCLLCLLPWPRVLSGFFLVGRDGGLVMKTSEFDHPPGPQQRKASRGKQMLNLEVRIAGYQL